VLSVARHSRAMTQSRGPMTNPYRPDAVLCCPRAALWLFALLCLAVMLVPGALRAQTLEMRRDAAIAAWLADDELTGLRGLADLAQQGDAQAQLFLGLIDRHAALQGPAVLGLSRAERIALLRAPGGLSGRNLVGVAAEQGHALARAWRSIAEVQGDLETAVQFAELGETRALAQALLSIAKRQEHGFATDIMAQDWYPETLLFLSPNMTLTPERAAELHPGDPQHRYLNGVKPPKAALQNWLAQAPAALHLRATCASVCPSEASQCVLALYHALGNYQALLTHGSPASSIVPDEELAASPRGQAALARRIMLMRSTRMREAERLKLAEVSLCATDWLAAQFEAHTTRKIPAPQ